VAAAQGDLRTAISSLQEAVALQPDLVEAHADLANLLAEIGRYGEAADEFGQVVEAQPENQPARFGYALSLMMAKRYPEAAASLEQSVTSFPDNAALKHVWARLLATCPDDAIRDGERALQLASEAMQSRPGFEQAQTLGMALAEVGRFEEAAELQRQLIQSVQDAGQDAVVPMLQSHLAAYEQGQAVRAPWLGGS
jgi:tetratricopeptide (TPR) repeat protein